MRQDRMAAMLERLAVHHPVLLLDDIDAWTRATPDCAPAGDPQNRRAWNTLCEWLRDACRHGALSLHLEPEGADLRVRQRLITGLEEQRLPITDALAASIALVAAQLRDPASTERAVRGFLFLACDRTPLLVETQLLRCVQGDTLHLRLIRQPDSRPGLDELGMDAEQSRHCRALLSHRTGLIVVSATDSLARTRTIRAMAQELISPDRRILCIEPPVHPLLSGCLQLREQAVTGDPEETVGTDIDIADIDGCFLAADASNGWTPWWLGRAQESTLIVKGSDSSDSARVLARLVAEGASPAWLAQGLRGIVFQAAVMGICPRCSRPARTDLADSNLQLDSDALASKDVSAWLSQSLTHRYVEAEGCADCRHRGFAESIAVFAISPMTDTARAHLMSGNIELAAQALDPSRAMTARVVSMAQASRIALPEATRISSVYGAAVPRY